MGWEVEGRFKGEGTYVYLWLINVDRWQKPIQYCKAIILQIKKPKLKKKDSKGENGWWDELEYWGRHIYTTMYKTDN